MAKRRHSALGKRLIASAKEMVTHAKCELRLQAYEVRLPLHVDVLAIRQWLELSQTEFARRAGLGARPPQTRNRRPHLLTRDRTRAEGRGPGAERCGVGAEATGI